MANPVAFPNRPFQLRMNVWVISQNVAANKSTLGWQIWIDKTGYSPTSSGGKAHRWAKVDGAYVHESYGNGFNFVSGDNFMLDAGTREVTHNENGTRSVVVEAAADFDILGATPLLSYSITLPTIPRASNPSFNPSNVLTTGTSVEIRTHRASTAFTHDISWTINGQSGTVILDLPTDYDWLVPDSLMWALPNAASGAGYITTVTKNGSTVIGSKNTAFTVNAGPAVVPNWSAASVVDGTTTPNVNTIMGSPQRFVQGISKFTGTITSPTSPYGGTVNVKRMKVGGATYDITSGDSVTTPVVTQTGTYNVTLEIIDSRGKVKTQDFPVTVLPYSPPAITSVTAYRSNGSGTPQNDGTAITVQVNSSVTSLVNGTEKNRRTVKVYTSPRGANTWTLRATPMNASTTLSGSTTSTITAVSFPTNQAFDIKVEVTDQFNAAAPTLGTATVSTAGAMLHLAPAQLGIGVGKLWTQGVLDIAGNAYLNDSLILTRADAASNAETQAGSLTTKFVTPASLASRTATDSRTGLVELATVAEARAGDATRAITGATLLGATGQAIVIPSATNGTINADGSISFSGLSEFNLDGIFSTSFNRFKIFLSITSLSAASTLFSRLRASGSSNSTTNYTYTRHYGQNGTTHAVTTTAANRFEVAAATSVSHDLEITVFSAAESANTRLQIVTTSMNSGGLPVPMLGAAFFTANTVFNGINFHPNSGNITGRATVYGLE